MPSLFNVFLNAFSGTFSSPWGFGDTFFCFTESGRYAYRGSITGFTGHINCLEVSPYGILACGGKSHFIPSSFLLTVVLLGPDGLSLFATRKLNKLSTPLHDVASRGTVSCLAWLTDPEGGDVHETLSFATRLGWLAVWQQSSKNVGCMLARKNRRPLITDYCLI